MTTAHPLTPLDAAFLLVESKSTPMHMATIGVFDGGTLYDERGEFRLADIRRLIDGRLDLVPKLRQRASSGLFGQAPPVWLDDPNFDVSEHVRVARLPLPGTEVELLQLCADLMAAPLERTRPLWDLTFVEGLAEGRVALIERLHHSMADGLAAAALATVLFDLSPETSQPEQVAPWSPAAGPSAWRSAADDLLRLAVFPVRAAKWYVESMLHPVRRTRELTDLRRAFGTIVSPRIVAPASSLNRTITLSRSVALVRLSLEQVHDVAHSFDTTINDVLLTVVAGGLREPLAKRGELRVNSELQALVPVGLVNVEGRGLANDVSALFVRLPIGLNDPVEVLRSVSREVGEEKRRHQALAAATVLRMLEPVPQDLLAVGAGVVHRQPFFNLVVTNVPGPSVPLYALGARLLEAFPLVPLVGNQSLSVAALSYDGQLNLGVLTNATTCPDADLFCSGLRACHKILVEKAQDVAPA